MLFYIDQHFGICGGLAVYSLDADYTIHFYADLVYAIYLYADSAYTIHLYASTSQNPH